MSYMFSKLNPYKSKTYLDLFNSQRISREGKNNPIRMLLAENNKQKFKAQLFSLLELKINLKKSIKIKQLNLIIILMKLIMILKLK